MNDELSPVESQSTSPSHPRWSCRCRAVTLRRRWCVRTGRFRAVWVLLVYTQTRCQRSHPATDHEGNLPLYTSKKGEKGKEADQIYFYKAPKFIFWAFFLTSTSNRVEPYPGHSLMMLMYFSMAWCCGMPCRRVHFSSTLVRVADVSSFTHISSICSSSIWNNQRILRTINPLS